MLNNVLIANWFFSFSEPINNENTDFLKLYKRNNKHFKKGYLSLAEMIVNQEKIILKTVSTKAIQKKVIEHGICSYVRY